MADRFKNTLYTIEDIKTVDGHLRYVRTMTERCTQVSTEPRLSRLIYRNGICTVGITSDSAICPPKASQTWFTFPAVSATTI